MKPLIALVGPTAVGKSSIALRLAAALGAEIVSADSRQVYRRMDIGTAKPSLMERAQIPHHLIDILDPDESWSLPQFLSLAKEAIEQIHIRRRPALLVGGSGLYVWSLLEGFAVPQVSPVPNLRAELEQRAREQGAESLLLELKQLDIVAAEKIDPRNVRRLVRAIEVCRSTGQRFSQLQQRVGPGFDTLVIGLTCPRSELYRRIDARVDQMVEQGLVEEVRELLSRGFGLDLPAMSSLGYRPIGLYLQGVLSFDEALRRMKAASHRLARQQYTWFRRDDPRIQWFDVTADVYPEVQALVEGFLAREATALELRE